jgi:hypothetical protein
MYIAAGQFIEQPSTTARIHGRRGRRSASKVVSPAAATALYFAGALIEALGIALVAAYGWIFAGGAIAVCGLLVGTIGNRHWPAHDKGLPSIAALKAYVRMSSSTGLASKKRGDTTARRQSRGRR